MANTTIPVYTRVTGVESFGFPLVTASTITLTETLAADVLMPRPGVTGDLEWQAAEFGLTAPSSGLGETANVWQVSAQVTHRVSDPADFSGVTAQLYNGSTPVGSPAAFTLSSTYVTDTITITTGYPPASMSALTVRLTYHVVQPGLALVSHAYAEASYSYPSSVGMLTVAGTASVSAMPHAGLPPVGLTAAGTTVTTLSPAFAQPTTAGDLLVAWVSSNSSSSSFNTATAAPGWQLAGFAGAAFGWNSLWYKPGCAASETPPAFTASGTTSPASQLLEFYGAGTLDQVAAAAGTNTIAITGNSPDTRSGDLLVGFAHWSGTNPGPTTMTMTGQDSSGAAVSLNVASNSATTGTAFHVTGWGQAGAAFGPGASTVTASLGVFANGGGVLASFVPTGTSSEPAATSLAFLNF